MKYLLLLAIVSVAGCMTSSSPIRPKTLNTSNLEKTNYGTYRLVSKSIPESGVKNGLTYKEPEKVKEIDSPSIGSEVVLPPKLKEQKKESSRTPAKKTVDIIPEGVVNQAMGEKENSPIRINWWGLGLFYLLAGWGLYIMWICWKTTKGFKEKLENPFSKKIEEEKKD